MFLVWLLRDDRDFLISHNNLRNERGRNIGTGGCAAPMGLGNVLGDGTQRLRTGLTYDAPLALGKEKPARLKLAISC